MGCTKPVEFTADQERRADEGYLDAGEMYAKDHRECRVSHAGEGIPQSVQDYCRREGTPTILKLFLSTTDVYRRTLHGIRFSFPKDLVGDGGSVSFPE